MEMQTENGQISHENRFGRLNTMSKHDIKSWLAEEKKFWTSIALALKGKLNTDKTEKNNLNVVDNYLNMVEFALIADGDISSLVHVQNETPLPFHDDLVFSEHLLPLTYKGQFSVARFVFEVSINSNHKNYLKTYDKHLQSIEESFQSNTDTVLKRYDDDLSEKISKLNESIEKSQKTIITQLESELNDAQQNIKNTVTAATSAILSAEPVKYWIDREDKHKKKAKAFLWLIGLASVSFIAVLVILSLSVYKNGEQYIVLGFPITLPAEKFSIALLIIATTSAIWIIRVLVKLMMTNLALEIEALERSTMIRTYIAMDNAKAEQAEEIRMLFYSTLFKPSNNSLTDDSTSPEYIRIIEAMLQKKT
ncbi:DUF6161 domain-containing protein [Pseudomonas sp. PAMC 25886]|uniref:DUF6161 domain-containing protein n=1 Tax=Pseudomonas sp. PAMC 25886 TaxID=1125977 RepID=UPI000289974D|nr:DUF6161 domain-containing protein [Pseudomonas sp. PAMC 25886]